VSLLALLITSGNVCSFWHSWKNHKTYIVYHTSLSCSTVNIDNALLLSKVTSDRLMEHVSVKNTYWQLQRTECLDIVNFMFCLNNMHIFVHTHTHIYIGNSSWHWGSYGSIWTGKSPKKYYMDRIFWGPYNIFLVTDRSIYCHMTRSDTNYLLYYTFYLK
jgi:hypothetical protein